MRNKKRKYRVCKLCEKRRHTTKKEDEYICDNCLKELGEEYYEKLTLQTIVTDREIRKLKREIKKWENIRGVLSVILVIIAIAGVILWML